MRRTIALLGLLILPVTLTATACWPKPPPPAVGNSCTGLKCRADFMNQLFP